MSMMLDRKSSSQHFQGFVKRSLVQQEIDVDSAIKAYAAGHLLLRYGDRGVCTIQNERQIEQLIHAGFELRSNQ